MNREEIKQFLPHREPMLLVDEVSLLNGVATGYYRVRGDEYFLQGHYPDNPIVPGVIQCEIMAQASCLLVRDYLQGRTPLYAGIDKVRFKRLVKPGETLTIRSHITSQKGMHFFVEAEAYVDEQLCAKGCLIFVIV